MTNLFSFNFAGLTFEPNILQAGAIVFLLFLLVMSLARIRSLFLNWSLGGWYAWVFMGFILTLIMEGFFLVSGKTVLTSLLGWKNAPEPIQIVLDTGKEKLVNVLGAEDKKVTEESVLSDFQSLPPESTENLRSVICEE